MESSIPRGQATRLVLRGRQPVVRAVSAPSARWLRLRVPLIKGRAPLAGSVSTDIISARGRPYQTRRRMTHHRSGTCVPPHPSTANSGCRPTSTSATARHCENSNSTGAACAHARCKIPSKRCAGCASRPYRSRRMIQRSRTTHTSCRSQNRCTS